MANAFIGNLGTYDSSTEKWPSYFERFKLFCTANDVLDEKKVPILLSMVGAKTFNLIRTLCAPEDVSKKTLDQLNEIITKHLSPKPIIIAERYRFHKRHQEVGESVADYVATIKKLSEHCEFNTYLNDALRDKLVLGLRNETIVKRLLSEADLTFDRAQQIAIAMETAAHDSREVSGVNGAKADVGLNKMSSVNKKSFISTCWRCKGTNHDPDHCFYKNQSCRECGIVGHIKRACRNSRLRTDGPGGRKKYKNQSWQKNKGKFHKQKEKVKHLSADSSDSDIPVKLLKDRSEPIWIDVVIDDKPMEMELDTGSGVSLISKEHYQDMFSDYELQPSDLTLSTYTKQRVIPLGMIMVKVKYGEKVFQDLKLYVTDTIGPPLFGRSWLNIIQLDWSQLFKTSIKQMDIDVSRKTKKLEDILNRHKVVFEGGIGKMNKIKANVTLKDSTVPKFCKPRPVAYALRSKIEEDLDRLVKEGILTSITHSDWATPIVPVLKRDGKLRICGDFKVTINPNLVVDQYPLPKIEDLFANLAGGHTFSKIDLAHAYQQMEVEEDSKKYLCINTHKGLFVYNRLPFGISSAPAVFQRAMEQGVDWITGGSVLFR